MLEQNLQLTTYQEIILNHLQKITSKPLKNNLLQDSINYTLNSKSKLARSIIILMGLKALGLDYHLGLDVAVAMEMIQSSTLIHDDLPEMDNGQIRRGQKCNHLVYGTNIALLAGDALLVDAFNVLAKAKLDDELKLALISKFSEKIGSLGVCYGQSLDVTMKPTSIDELFIIIKYKTCALFELAFLSIGLIAKLNNDKLQILEKIGTNFGLAFQIYDDLLDQAANNLYSYHQMKNSEEANLKIIELMKEISSLCQQIFNNDQQIISYLKTLLNL